jgi:peptidoglycan/LPS O-acetylase OafA/YrhL
LAVVLLLIPVAKLSGAAPTPGGFGSAEAVLTALLVATIGVDAAVAGAAALLYRASAFWLPFLVGGMATAWYVTNDPLPARSHSITALLTRSSEEAVTPQIGHDNMTWTPVLVFTVPMALVVLVAVSVHSRRLLIEPDSLLVHTTWDTALVVLSFGLTWLTLRRVAGKWVE